MINPLAGDTIAALATPPGISALAIIRVSGPSLKNIYSTLTKSEKPPKPRYAALCKIYNSKDDPVDSCIITYFNRPKSFTGEDVVEISCHGGEYTTSSILKILYSLGIRKAEPGEFSYRAFINGKIDLLQAESISGLIAAKTEKNAEIQLKNLDGYLTQAITNIRDSSLKLLTILEHELDFSEEEITHISHKNIVDELHKIKDTIKSMLSTSSVGKIIKSGIRVVLFGKPNVGKSSLFNRMIGAERAIVTQIPGTTRDIIEAWLEINGIPICVVDTAGIHDTKELLESIGIEKTKGAVNQSDIIFIIDDKDPIKFYKQFSSLIVEKTIIFIQSKSDLYLPKRKQENISYISMDNDLGIKKLFTKLSTTISAMSEHNLNDGAVIVSKRQAALLNRSLSVLELIFENISSNNFDIVSSLLREFTGCLEEMIGVVDNNEILEGIFSEFCVGK